jgi:hypothetical protein
MPHAVMPQRPAFYPHQFSGDRISTSYDFSHDTLPSTSKPVLPLPARVHTPPADMSTGLQQHGRANGLQPNMFFDRDAARLQTRPQTHLHQTSYLTNSPPLTADMNGHRAVGKTKPPQAAPSPQSQNSSSVPGDAAAVEAPVAPSLRIPDTIRTPQTGLPQLAAEVRISPCSAFAVANQVSDYLPLLVRRRLHP